MENSSRDGNTSLSDLPPEKYAGQEVTVRTGHGTTDWLQFGKLSSGHRARKAGIKIARRNINNHRYADDTTLMAESEEELKTLFKKVKEESEKVGLKLNIQKTKIMASSPMTSWEIDGETVETVSDFILGGSKITADGNCNKQN